jgi:hypothetical protein
VIALIGNRPTLQVGHYQVHDYDTCWVGDALRRAAVTAGTENFPFLEEIRQGIEDYLEHHCSLELLPLPTLYERVRRMLHQVGCASIAHHLEPVAPPLTVALDEIAARHQDSFELGFFEGLRRELRTLAAHGAEQLHFCGLRRCVLTLRQRQEWAPDCDELAAEIRAFLQLHLRDVRLDPADQAA